MSHLDEKIKILAQESYLVHLFGEMTNSPALLEKKLPLPEYRGSPLNTNLGPGKNHIIQDSF